LCDFDFIGNIIVIFQFGIMNEIITSRVAFGFMMRRRRRRLFTWALKTIPVKKVI